MVLTLTCEDCSKIFTIHARNGTRSKEKYCTRCQMDRAHNNINKVLITRRKKIYKLLDNIKNKVNFVDIYYDSL